MSKINVKGTEITILEQNGEPLVSLTDMVRKADDGDQLIKNWLKTKNTLEYLGVWEKMNNPNFNLVEFDQIRIESGVNKFTMSGKQWIEKTGAIGIVAKAGRYGGTYAHMDIALNFAMWISPEFQLLIVKEFQRLKNEESKTKNLEWDYRRFLTKANYRLQTDAIKENILPQYSNLSRKEEGYVYADEAELINMAVFGITSKQWRKENPAAVKDGLNIRDLATIPQLHALSNAESMNSHLITKGKNAATRLNVLKELVVNQLKSWSKTPYEYSIESPHLPKFQATSTLDRTLKGMLAVPPIADQDKEK